MTLRSAWMQARSRLERAGIDDASLESEVILRHALGVDRAAFFAALEEHPDSGALRPRGLPCRAPPAGRAPRVHPGPAGILRPGHPSHARRPHTAPGDGADRRRHPGARPRATRPHHRRRGVPAAARSPWPPPSTCPPAASTPPTLRKRRSGSQGTTAGCTASMTGSS